MEHQDVTDLNQQLKTYCLEQEISDKGIETGSIEGGYHSSRQYWKQESTTPLAKLGDLSMRMTGWSVILREGDVSKPHTHPGAQLSGVYYVSTHDDPMRGGGELVLADPRIRATVSPVVGQKSNALFQPKNGITVLFPSFLEHYVLPFKGSGERISIAYNMSLSPKSLQSD